MTEPEQSDPELQRRAEEFAHDLTRTVRAVAGEACEQFTAEIRSGERRGRVAVVHRPSPMIPLSLGGTMSLHLKVEVWLTWDGSGEYLAVEEASFKVLGPAGRGEPLFRYEFLRAPEGGIPGAHLHVHAHRDEFTHALLASGTASPRAERRHKSLNRPETPRMSELHFPLGGPRYRPCLEDVVTMLIDEFGVDVAPNGLDALAEGREGWRRMQLAAAVRDAPSEAARVLGDLGYTVIPPATGHVPDAPAKLRAY